MTPRDWLPGVVAIIGVILAMTVIYRPARADTDIRLSAGFGLHHDRGYEAYNLRIGKDGGIGLRLGAMRSPTQPDVTLAEVDYEYCYGKLCGALGVAKLSDRTHMNGTEWNFGLHARYAVTPEWSLVLDHYSHGRMLGIAKNRSNRGWNLLGVAYTF